MVKFILDSSNLLCNWRYISDVIWQWVALSLVTVCLLIMVVCKEILHLFCCFDAIYIKQLILVWLDVNQLLNIWELQKKKKMVTAFILHFTFCCNFMH